MSLKFSAQDRNMHIYIQYTIYSIICSQYMHADAKILHFDLDRRVFYNIYYI